MKGLLPCLSVLGLLGISNGQSVCPPPEVLSPCTCREETHKEIYCQDIEDPTINLKQVFDRASEFIGEDVMFRHLFIRNLTITEIGERTCEHLKFDTIYINRNPHLEWISPRAFGATKNVTAWLILMNNNLKNDAPRERDIFELINGFVNLTGVNLHDNRLTSIPSNAVTNLQFLTSFHVTKNPVDQIGSRAFATVENPHLERRINLKANAIPSAGLHEDAFADISTSATVNLMENGMNFLEQKSYEALLDRVAKVEVGIQVCTIWECHYERVFDCDERADWICDKEDAYRPRLGNSFACKEESGFLHVWEYCAERNNKSMRINCKG